MRVHIEARVLMAECRFVYASLDSSLSVFSSVCWAGWTLALQKLITTKLGLLAGESAMFSFLCTAAAPPSPGPFYPRSSVHPPKPPSSHAPWNSDEDRNPRLCRASNAKSCFFKREKHRLSFERLRRRHRHAAGMRGINEGRAMFALVWYRWIWRK